jgi:tetratricopeptide (TPR) repeat protein
MKLEPALAYLQRLATSQPSSGRICARLAQVHSLLGNYAEAVASISEALKQCPQSQGFLLDRAILAQAKGNLASAVKDSEMALAIDNTYAYARHVRALLFLEQGRVREALEECDALIRSDKLSQLYYMDRSTVYVATKQLEKAQKDLETACQLDRGCAACLVNLGYVYGRRQLYDKAIDCLTEAIIKEPWSADAFFNRSTAHQKCNHADQALADAENAITLDSKNGMYRCQRAECLRNMKQYSKAKSDYAAAIARSPNNAWVLSASSWFLATCPVDSMRDGELALVYARKACQITHWNNIACIIALAAAYAEKGDFDNAVLWQSLVVQSSELNEEGVQISKKRLKIFEKHLPFRE